MVADWVVHPVESDKCDAQSDGGGAAQWWSRLGQNSSSLCSGTKWRGGGGGGHVAPRQEVLLEKLGIFLIELHDKNWGWYSVRAREIRLPARLVSQGHGMHSSFIEAAHLCFIIWLLLIILSKQRHF